MKKITGISLAVLLAWSAAGFSCGGNNNTSNPNRGFDIQTQVQFPNGLVILQGGNAQGQFQSGPGTSGTVTSFNRNVNPGITTISGAKVPGVWRLAFGPAFFGDSCLTFVVENRNVSSGSLERLTCPGRFFGFTATADTIDAFNPPATVDITGSGSETLYGTPMIAFYNEFGNVVASTPANQLLYTDGAVSGVRVGVSDLSQVYDGIYSAVVHNVQADGTWEIVGSASVTVYGNPPPPPDPGGGGGGCEPQPQNQEQLPCDTYNTY